MKAMSATRAMDLLQRAGAEGGLAPCVVEINVEHDTSREDVARRLSGGAGVIVYTDRVVEVDGSGGPPEADRLLSADVVDTGGARSVQVRWDGGAYVVTTATEKAGDEHLRDMEEHLSVLRGRRVRHAVYLRPRGEGVDPEVGVWRPFAARFLGVVPDQGKEA